MLMETFLLPVATALKYGVLAACHWALLKYLGAAPVYVLEIGENCLLVPARGFGGCNFNE